MRLLVLQCRECGFLVARNRNHVIRGDIKLDEDGQPMQHELCSARIPGDDEGRCSHVMRAVGRMELDNVRWVAQLECDAGGNVAIYLED